MKGIILLIVGLILAGAGVFAFFLIGVVFEGVAVESFPYDLSGLQGILQYGVGALVGSLGPVYVVWAVISCEWIKEAKARQPYPANRGGCRS